MNEPVEESPPRTYRWPWFLLAAVLLGIVIAVIWVGYAAHRVEEERNFNAPLPAQGH